MPCNETREWSIEAFALSNAAAEAKEQDRLPSWQRRRFQEGDLVLVRDFQGEKNRGRKLEPRWTGPQVLSTLNPGGRTAMVPKFCSP